MVPKGKAVLDAGCGAGVPVSRFLVTRGYSVTGIDLSSTMIALAKQHVPNATFIEMDMRKLSFSPNSFGGITCIYSFFHIPREEHKSMLERFFTLLEENGVLLFNTCYKETDEIGEFFGEEMYWSSYSPEKTLALTLEAGFAILFEGILDRGDELQYWIFAKKL